MTIQYTTPFTTTLYATPQRMACRVRDPDLRAHFWETATVFLGSKRSSRLCSFVTVSWKPLPTLLRECAWIFSLE